MGTNIDTALGSIPVTEETTVGSKGNVSRHLHLDGADIFQTHLHRYPGEFRDVPTWEVAVKISLCVLVMVLSLVGNFLVIYIVWQNKLMRSTTNFYIVNLALADLMVTASCTWVNVVDDLTEGWILGAFFCKFNSFAQVLSLVSSSLTLTLISCDRFFGIVFAMKAHLTERRPGIFILLIWLFSVILSLPLLIFRQEFVRQWLDHREVWCGDNWPAAVTAVNGTEVDAIRWYLGRSFYYTFVSSVLFFFPIAIMAIAYLTIIRRLWSSSLPGERLNGDVHYQEKARKKVVIMLTILLVLFAFCWLPLQVAILYDEHRPYRETKLPDWYGKFQYFATFVAHSNSALNPIVYAGFNENFRRGFLSIFCIRRITQRYSSIALRRNSSCRSSTLVTRI